jgi:hypothetical protein
MRQTDRQNMLSFMFRLHDLQLEHFVSFPKLPLMVFLKSDAVYWPRLAGACRLSQSRDNNIR